MIKIIVKILVNMQFKKIETNAWKLKYSKPNIMKWWIKVRTEIKISALGKEIDLKLKSK